MSLMERVREIRADEAQVDGAQLNTARQALLREIARAEHKPARRRIGWIGAGGLVAAGIVGALVIGNVVAPPESAVAAVLEEAADVAVTGEAFEVPAGSFLRVSDSGEWFVPWDADMPDETSRFNNGDVAEAEAVLQLRGTTELYIPSDRSGAWIQASGETDLVASYGDQAEQATLEFTTQNGGRFGAAPSALSAPGGAYQGPGAFGESDHTYYLDNREYWADQPTDPRELLAWMRTSMGEQDPDSAASDNSIVETLADSIGNAAAPPERRAAWLRVLALLGGSSIESVDGDVTTIRFSWSTEWWDAWTLIEIDTARGVVLGVTRSGALSGGEQELDGLPAWASRSTFAYEVVDSAPAPTD
ncbi:hypothetical protein [Microbacterium rhizophilus]|uniref:hypothetical protein n=1 Tax=Microbacterium rhizophilus TaxID=3138934 RepID=UPI0031E61560